MANFNWEKEVEFKLTGEQFEHIYNSVNMQVQKEATGQPVNEFIRLDLLRESHAALNHIFEEGVKSGVITEVA